MTGDSGRPNHEGACGVGLLEKGGGQGAPDR